ncbi:MAG: nitrite/sulfite reductase [Spirochaetaceae bacterium]
MFKLFDELTYAPDQVREIIKNYRSSIIDSVEFSAKLKLYGAYVNRNSNLELFTLRTRIPGGIISADQLRGINEINNSYSTLNFHITTRQNIQFQKIKLDDIPNILEELLELGITTKAAAGKVPRNIVAPPLAGIEIDEPFDISPYVLSITESLLRDETNFTLPAKFQISISNNIEDHSKAKMADIGFIAVTRNGKAGFEVYGGGGQGSYVKLGIKLLDFVNENTVLHCIEAMKEVLITENEHKNAKKRTRFIARNLGDDSFKELFIDCFNRRLDINRLSDLDIEKYRSEYIETEGETIEFDNKIIFETRVKGRYAVNIQPEKGNITSKELTKLLIFIDTLDYTPSIRLSHDQGFFIRELCGKDVERLNYISHDFLRKNKMNNIVSCPGSNTCRIGITDTGALTDRIKHKFQNESTTVKMALPEIYISGCPNACGSHHLGNIGLYGFLKKDGDRFLPLYKVMFGGRGTGSSFNLAKEVATLPVNNVSCFLVDLAKLKVKNGISDFNDFIEKNSKEIDSIISKYTEFIFFEDSDRHYKDVGSSELFNPRKRA